MKDVTLILQRIQKGQLEASEGLFPAVYDELRRLAAAKMKHERADHTLSSTALVHEAYVRLVDTDSVREWNCRGHFFSAAAEAMRRILVDHARKKNAVKRGGGLQCGNSLSELSTLPPDLSLLLDLDDALRRLEQEDPQSAELVKLVLFAGTTVSEGGQMLGLSRDVTYRQWEFIRRWFAVHCDQTMI